MKDPHDRLKDLRLRKGFERAADAARAFGWAVTTYQAHENGSRGLKMDAAARYAKAFGSTVAYILTGTTPGNPQGLTYVNSVTLVPVVAKASAGAFRYDEGLESEGVEVPAVPRANVPANVQYAVIVDGSSVNLRIADGAFAICAPLDKMPGGAKHGQLVHVVRERAGLHEHTIKEIQYTRTGVMLMPCSSDPRFQEAIDMAAPEDDTTVTIRGIVIGAFQPL